MPTITGVLETVLYVEDMQRSLEFYREVLGFPVLYPSERLSALRVAPYQVLVIITQGADVQPTVLPFGTIPPSDGKGELHVAFGIPPDQLDQWREALERHGVDIESAIEWPEGGHSLYVRDPDQHCVELKTSDWGGALLPVGPGGGDP